MKAIKKNLKDQILTSDTRVLHCPVCDAEYSGNSGDYWNLPDDYVFHCQDCQVELELVKKVVSIEYKD